MAARRSSYVAAVAPNSGGLTEAMPYQDPSHVPATFTMHGGAADNVGVNFGTTSQTFNDQTVAAGGFAVECNHEAGHCAATAELYTAAIDFLLAHPFAVDPEPYAAGLPDTFPNYCLVR